MKRKLMSLLLMFSLVFGTIASIPATKQAIAAEEKVTYEKKTVTTYLFSKEKTGKMDIYIPSDLPEVPYVSVENYLDTIYETDFKEKKTDSGVYEIKDDHDATMTIDVNKDSLSSSSIYVFICGNRTNQDGIEDTTDLPVRGADDLSHISAKPVTLALSDYGIDLIEKDDKAYLPLPTLNDLFIATYNAAEYLNGKLYFIHTMDLLEGMSGGTPVYCAEEQSSLYESSEFSETFAAFNYNEFCFMIDHIYGKPTQAKIASSVESVGLDKTLDELDKEVPGLKASLKSTNRVENNLAMLALMNYFYDQGHTNLAGSLGQYRESPVYKGFIDKIMNPGKDPLAQAARLGVDTSAEVANKTSGLTDIRIHAFDDAYGKKTVLKEWNGGIASINAGKGGQVLIMEGTTALFSFDEFDKASIYAFKEALDLAREKGAGSFIIDLGNNGGGLLVACYYMCTILDKIKNNTKNTIFTDVSIDAISGSLAYDACDYDLNLDGKFDEADKELQYDFDFAILTSEYSYSAANTLPCLSSEVGIPIIGEKSSGGTCMLSIMHMSDYTCNLISGPIKSMHSDGKTDLDGGAAVNVNLVQTDAKGNKDYSLFYDLDVLGKAAANPSIKQQKMTVKADTKTIKSIKLKKADVAIKKAIKVKSGKGKVTYKCTSKKYSIDKNGTITIKKGKYKAGTVLKVKVNIAAAGNKNFLPATKTVTVKIKVV